MTRMSTRIEVGRRHIEVSEQGAERDPVLLIHSSGLGARQWRRTVEALGSRHRVIVPDLIGYGASSPVAIGERVHFAMDLLALERLLDDVHARHAQRVHVVGHSYGGFLALLLSLHRPALVRSIAVYEPVSFGVLRSENDDVALATLPSSDDPWPSDAEAIEAWLDGFIAYWNGPGAWQTLPEPMRATFRATAPKVLGEVLTLGADRTPLEGYSTLQVPTLLLGSETPTLAADHVLAALARTIPEARRVAIEGAGHMGPITHAAQVGAELAALLASA